MINNCSWPEDLNQNSDYKLNLNQCWEEDADAKFFINYIMGIVGRFELDKTKTFVTTVADCFLRDQEEDVIVMKSKTLVNSNIAFKVDDVEIRGGEFSKLLHNYNHSKKGEITFEQAEYNPVLLAIWAGQSIQNEMSDIYVFEEKVTLDEFGIGKVLLETPVLNTNAYVQFSDGNIITTNLVGSQFLMDSKFANQVAYVTYRYKKDVNTIIIEKEKFSKIYELVMEVKTWGKTGLKERIQWVFPAFKISGNFEMSLASDAPVTSALTGVVLNNNGIFGYKRNIMTSNIVNYHAIAANVNDVEIDTGETYTFTVYGVRSGLYMPVVLPNSGLGFESSDNGIAIVNHLGEVKHVGSGIAYIKITYDNFTDIVNVICK